MDPNRMIEPNMLSQREQWRQQVQEQIQQRELRRRQYADQNRAPDANVLAREKSRYELEERNTYAQRQKLEGGGEQYKQQLAETEQQIQQELAKHRERLAKLVRIRELAQKQNDAETVGRADKAIEKEQRRYEVMTARMERRKNALIKFAEQSAIDVNTGRAVERKDVNLPQAGNK
jgi:hypothetical protein